MGIFSKVVAESDVSFAGILEYAESGDEDIAVSAQVQIEQHRPIGGKDPLPMFGGLGAARLLSMLRREPHYVIPFMGLVESVAENLEDDDQDPANFSVRGTIVTDPKILQAVVGASTGGMRTAELNLGIPRLVANLPGAVERSTTLELHEARNGMGSVRFKFGLGSSNALTTIGAWTATVDALVAQWPRQEMAIPIALGLRAVGAIWENFGHPLGIGIREGAEVEAQLTDLIARSTPD